MSRALRGLILVFAVVPVPLAAQDALDAQTGTPPERIDLMTEATRAVQNPPDPRCEEAPDDFAPDAVIVVCGGRDDAAAAGYDREAARARYAAKTMNKGDPRAPDVFGIPNHGVVAARGCFIPPCPPPPAYMIDFASLPEAPPGSDADRIARGLAPLGQPEAGTPPAPSPSGSASPAAPPSD